MKTKPKNATHFKSKKAILDYLKMHGPTDALFLAERLHTTGMGARQHLYDLQEQGVVTFSLAKAEKGRPAKLWRLTSKADEYFPDTHGELTSQILQSVQQSFGQAGIERILARRKQAQVKEYRGRIHDRMPLREKVKVLAALRTQEGYMANVDEINEGEFELVENHCPICTAATSCPGLCEAELEVFKNLMGETASVVRTEHIVSGQRRCLYRVSGK